MESLGRSPVLVTGMPRSGTTWLARLLATAPGTALAGREPMNPHRGQYGLAKTLDGWASLQTLTPRQKWAVRSCYWGANPLVYSKFGRRQWAAPLPWTRLVVKDPFALLSLPCVARATGASVVVVYRHPAAALASYRRMGWRPDLEQLQRVIVDRNAGGLDAERLPDLPRPGEVSEAEAMGRFWAALYSIALADLQGLEAPEDSLIVSHQELAAAGPVALGGFFANLGLTWSDDSAAEMNRESRGSAAPNLHNLDRRPSDVATSWTKDVSPDDLTSVERVAGPVLARLEAARHRMASPRQTGPVLPD